MWLVEVNGDLFSYVYPRSIGHCVSADFNMGKGIAKEFKQRFGNVDKLRQTTIGVGGLAYLQFGNNFVYYLVTKKKHSDFPTYETLQIALNSLKQHVLLNNVQDLHLPKIG